MQEKELRQITVGHMQYIKTGVHAIGSAINLS